MSDDNGKPDKGNQWQSPRAPHQEKAEDMKLWGILVFGLIGASATTLAVSFTHFFFRYLANFLVINFQLSSFPFFVTSGILCIGLRVQ